ncbi:MAG TPA: hypothetical protein VM145_02030 [Sphingomicrobium sp.]|nr:hypothetical protein [Sphingomicrobium sp.]
MILRFLNIQGIAGIAVGLALAILLLMQKVETRHWRKQSAGFEQLYRAEQAAFAGSVANYRAAADQARAADRANAERVRAGQAAINEGSNHAFEIRLADARARARRLRHEAANSAADPGARRSAPVPGLPAAPGGIAQAPGENGLPPPDALTATEQAIQLDELIKWVRAQHEVDNQGVDAATSH